jgi:hypothetical protein
VERGADPVRPRPGNWVSYNRAVKESPYRDESSIKENEGMMAKFINKNGKESPVPKFGYRKVEDGKPANRRARRKHETN